MKPQKEFIFVHESMKDSIIKDAVTFVMVVGVIGVGVWAESSAMQWAGFLMLGLVALARSVNNRAFMTPEQAYEHIQKLLDKQGSNT
jgi:hypothetical protein